MNAVLASMLLVTAFLGIVSCGPPCSSCQLIRLEVCGEDGVTYGNECQATCNGVKVAYAGPCQEPTDPNNCPDCSSGGTPVCGQDGVTYQNLCFLRCNGVKKANNGAC